MIPTANAPGLSRNKQKAGMGIVAVTASDTKRHSCNLSINVEKKKVDGVPTVCYMVDNYNFNYMKSEPLKEIYTDKTKFANDVRDAILAIGDKL